uniref:Rho-related GTP-binding protein RhoH isoform X1 n=1 Tax=Pogona vitticeps TaxID=103695 RepID=A0ABM5GHZ1_9SAUR
MTASANHRILLEETFTSQAHSTFRQRLSGPWPLEALKFEMCAGHPKIWKTCNMSLKCFIAFRQEEGLPSTWPLPANQIQRFILSMDVQGLPPSVIQMYVAALSSMSRLLDFPDPLQDFSTWCMMENLQQQTGLPTPLTMEVLGGLVGSLEEVCSNLYECLLFRAAFVLSFFLALQPEEVAVESCASPHPDLLYMSDCEIQQDSIGLRLCTSETGLERSMYRFARSPGDQLCPVAILHSYLAVRPHGEGPLFMYIDEHPLPREHFLIIFYSALRRLGLPWEQYNMHSFWFGSIVTVVKHRCPGTIIRRLTRWQRRGIRRRQDGQR